MHECRFIMIHGRMVGLTTVVSSDASSDGGVSKNHPGSITDDVSRLHREVYLNRPTRVQ